MAQFKFVKPYSTSVTVGGVIGINTKYFAVGDSVDGTRMGSLVQVRLRPHTALDDLPPSNMSSDEFLLVPSDYLSADIFTGKNIVFAIIVIAVVFGILKLTKII